MWPAIISAGVGLLGMSEQRKANSMASDSTAQANAANNALRNQAMPYALQNLKTNDFLQKFYQKQPFNDQQKTGYQNQNNLIDSFNGQVAPGLLNFANGMMGQSYSRQKGGAPGSAGGYGGLMQESGRQTMQMPTGGNQGQGLLAPFSMPKQEAFGQIDWDKQNPFSAENLKGTDLQNLSETQDGFNSAAYLAANPDVAAHGTYGSNPWQHYQEFGKNEGRKYTKRG
jgi:hypothetical protein